MRNTVADYVLPHSRLKRMSKLLVGPANHLIQSKVAPFRMFPMKQRDSHPSLICHTHFHFHPQGLSNLVHIDTNIKYKYLT